MSYQIKKSLTRACVEHIEKRINTIKSQLDLIEESRNNETKSSVGDKYETGRAMMQMEEDKLHGQLRDALNTRQVIQSIDPEQIYKHVQHGSLVQTTAGIYFISIGLGKIEVEGERYFCISPDSPVGLILLNKSVGDAAEFRGTEIVIQAIY